jgi:hypothetical protein
MNINVVALVAVLVVVLVVEGVRVRIHNKLPRRVSILLKIFSSGNIKSA